MLMPLVYRLKCYLIWGLTPDGIGSDQTTEKLYE